MFRLLELEIRDHKVIGNVKINFKSPTGINNCDSIFTSVIIGANGIGKSILLRLIVDVFDYLRCIAEQKQQRSLGFKVFISWIKNNSTYRYCNFVPDAYLNFGNINVDKTSINKDGFQTNISIDDLPNRIIASTIAITDKFSAISNGMYRYSGIRNERSTSTTGTRTLVRKAVENLAHSLTNKVGFLEELRMLFRQLGLHPSLDINYGINHKRVFLSGHLNTIILKDIFTSQKKYFPNRKIAKIWGTSNFEKIKDDDQQLQIICDYLNNCQRNNMHASYRIFDDPQNFIRDWGTLKLLSSLDIITYPKMRIYKQNSYAFENSSSGETHLLCQFIGLMAEIKPESMILIDEPENSCHPNWQIDYINWLKTIFNTYSDCHFIIATHSHFLLTDLEPDHSSIIALERDNNGELKDVANGENTYCWSTDEILYKVFHVRNTRNRFFEDDMYRLYELISSGQAHSKEVLGLIEKLNRYKLSDNDPLNRLFNIAKENAESK